VIDRNLILQRSAAGKDMVNQTQNLSKAAETQFRNEETQLANEATALQQQMAILAPDAREQKQKEFITKQQAFQARVQQRQAEIQAGFNKAARELEIALEPILQGIMKERGANLVLDRGAVILASIDIDVSGVAVQRLDKALPRLKVDLVPLPAGSVPTADGAGGALPGPGAQAGRAQSAPVRRP
jgi:Skp family chaperone for outer membrane proteins